jgi:hypothetical protein
MSSMNPTIRCTFGAFLALLIAACQSKPTPAQPVEQASAPVAASDACAPISELNALDPRRPVPLQPMMAWHQKQNMQDHLVAIQRIVDALAQEDWEAIGTASERIESSPQMQQMCEHMGAGAEGFTEQALEFHRRADAIGEAAAARDAQAVLSATSNTLQACTSCHSTYRQEIVDAETWTSRTGQAHDPAMMHGGH